MKSNSRLGKHGQYENFGKTQGKDREFENLNRPGPNQESGSTKYGFVTLMVFMFSVTNVVIV